MWSMIRELDCILEGFYTWALAWLTRKVVMGKPWVEYEKVQVLFKVILCIKETVCEALGMSVL